MNEIVMIPIEKLKHHPANPRKDLGDLTELTESIKEQGILQNMTVIPTEAKLGEYYVIIGNRRMEASKAAGLTELPCVIVEMGLKEAMATMISENMQRSDLTVYEQAKGMQVMLELGLTKDEISQKTGFGRTTVDRRLAIASLPDTPTENAVSLGYDLLDLVEISKIEDKEKQKELLLLEAGDEQHDPRRIRQAIRSAKIEEERQREKKRLLPQIEKFAKKMKNSSERFSTGWEHVYQYDVKLEQGAEVKVPKSGQYFYFEGWGIIEIYKKVEKEKRVKTEREIEMEKKKADAKDLNTRMKENRIAFVSSFTPNKTQEAKLQEKIWGYVFGQINKYDQRGFRTGYHNWDGNLFRQLCGMPLEEGRDTGETMLEEINRRGIPKGRAILAWILCGGVEGDVREGYASTYDGTYKADEEDMDRVYKILTDNGYVMTDEEQMWKDGTHPLYGGDEK